jgi:hypothetical protein
MYGDPSLYKAAYEKSLIKSRLKAIKESQEEHTLTPEEVNALDENSIKPLPQVKSQKLPT